VSHKKEPTYFCQ